MSSLQDLATAYYRLGLVPLPLKGGTPLVAWRRFIDPYPRWEDVAVLPWRGADGIALVLGHPCPAGGYWWVLDVEVEHRAGAEAWLDRHLPGWREGLVAESQRDGLHLYLRSAEPVRSGRCVFGDVKGQGGLIFAPPTPPFKSDARHPYRWLSPAGFPLVAGTEPLSLLILACEPSIVPGAGAGAGQDVGERGNENGHRPLDVAAVLDGVPAPGRHDALFKLAARLRAADVPFAWALRLVGEAAGRCTPPYPSARSEEPVERLVERVYGRYAPGPVLLLPSQAPSSLSPSLKVSDSDDDAPDDAALPAGRVGGGQREPVAVWLAAEPGPRAWVIDELLPDGAGLITAWYGDDGSGKSLLALAVAEAVTSGRPFLGRHPGRTGPVLYIDTEFAPDEFVRRAYAVARGMGLERPPEGLWYLRADGSLVDEGEQRRIARAVAAVAPVLVVVDSVTLGTWDADLKEATATVALMQFLERLPAPVLAIDHIPKPLAGQSLAYSRPWGSFAKRAKARHAVLVVQGEDGGLLLRVAKTNLSRPGGTVGAVVDFDRSDRSDRDGAVIRIAAAGAGDERLAGTELHLPPLEQVAQVLARLGVATPEELAEATGLAVGTVKNKLTLLRRQGRARPVGGGRWQAVSPDPDRPSSPSLGLSDDDGDDDPPSQDGASSSPSLPLRDSDSDGGGGGDDGPGVVPVDPTGPQTPPQTQTPPSSLSLALSDGDSDDGDDSDVPGVARPPTGTVGGDGVPPDRVERLAERAGFPRYVAGGVRTVVRPEGWRAFCRTAPAEALAEAQRWLLDRLSRGPGGTTTTSTTTSTGAGGGGAAARGGGEVAGAGPDPGLDLPNPPGTKSWDLQAQAPDGPDERPSPSSLSLALSDGDSDDGPGDPPVPAVPPTEIPCWRCGRRNPARPPTDGSQGFVWCQCPCGSSTYLDCG